jgi:hypothetical protein
MSSRFQITDSVGKMLILEMSENWLDYNGQWMPDSPGKVASGPEWENNQYDAVDRTGNGHPYDASLYKVHATGSQRGWRQPVMTLYSIIGVILYEASGMGYLSHFAAGTLQGGNISWQKL